jgi:hypothetical protein
MIRVSSSITKEPGTTHILAGCGMILTSDWDGGLHAAIVNIPVINRKIYFIFIAK